MVRRFSVFLRLLLLSFFKVYQHFQDVVTIINNALTVIFEEDAVICCMHFDYIVINIIANGYMGKRAREATCRFAPIILFSITTFHTDKSQNKNGNN